MTARPKLRGGASRKRSGLHRGLNPRHYRLWPFGRLPTGTNQSVADLTPATFAKLQASTGACPTTRPVSGLSNSRAIGGKLFRMLPRTDTLLHLRVPSSLEVKQSRVSYACFRLQTLDTVE